MKYFLCLLPLILMISQCRNKEEKYLSLFPGKPNVPSSIKQEHNHLLAQIHSFTAYQDSTGLVAIKLDSLMQHHFQEEEDFVLPPLGHLPVLASGEKPAQPNKVIQLTEHLKSQLVHMSAEHQLIKAYLNELKQAADHDHHRAIIEFEKELHNHANTEEEIFFPAAILVGEYLKLNAEPGK